MLVYKDVFTGDEMIGDSYDLKVIDDVVYEADCKMIDIGVGNVDIGANASAEEVEEGTEDGVEKVNNVVYSFKLAPTSFDKKSYMTYIKGYMKKVKAHLQETNPDRIPIFEKGIASFVKKVLGNFSDYEFYTGESMNPDGMVALLNYREDGVTPFFSYCKFCLQYSLTNSQRCVEGGEILDFWSHLEAFINCKSSLREYARAVNKTSSVSCTDCNKGISAICHDPNKDHQTATSW